MTGRSPRADPAAAVGFAVLCLVWGSTWVALKLGLSALPPILFAGLRFALAGTALALWLTVWRQGAGLAPADRGRLIAPALLMIAANYGLMAWGVARVPSGLAALINLGTIPIAMLVCAVAAGRERIRPAGLAALGLGVGGLGVLFAPAVDGGAVEMESGRIAGMAAIVVGAVAYAAGSILGTGRAAGLSVVAVAAWQMLVGGGALVAVAVAVEPVGPALAGGLGTPAGWASLLYLAGVGSLIGFTVYLWLLRRWPASRVAVYAFVSPVVAVVLGALVLGETLHPHQGLAALLLLGGAALALGSRG